MRAGWIFAAALALGLTAYGRDRFDDWIADTRLPILQVAVGTEVLDRNGDLLRAYTAAGGRWRRPAAPGRP